MLETHSVVCKGENYHYFDVSAPFVDYFHQTGFVSIEQAISACYFLKILLVSISRTPKVKRGLQGITVLVTNVYFRTILQNDMPIIVHIDVANVDDERTVNALEHIRVQLWLNISHRARLSVTLSINHVDNTVVLHCLNISNVTDSDSLASHTTTNQEYIGRVQTLV